MGKFRNIVPEGTSRLTGTLAVINPFNWYREIKFERQRIERGWSDRDAWNGGDYILKISSDIVKKLASDKSHVDWKRWFSSNIVNARGYQNLSDVAKDIDNYLAFDDSYWVDRLGFEMKHGEKELPEGGYELVNLNSVDENRRIRKAIRESHEEEKRLYEKAKNAMIFVAVNFRSLWD